MGAEFLQPEEKAKDQPNYSLYPPNGSLYAKQTQPVLTGAKQNDKEESSCNTKYNTYTFVIQFFSSMRDQMPQLSSLEIYKILLDTMQRYLLGIELSG